MKTLFLLFLILPFASEATLGEKIGSAQGKTALREMARTSASFRAFSSRQSRIEVHQFADAGGRVFAVTWKGPNHPDLQDLLGSHLEDFKSAVKKAKQSRRGHSPIEIDEGGLHVEMGGGPRAVFGRVWLDKEMPPGMEKNEIR